MVQASSSDHLVGHRYTLLDTLMECRFSYLYRARDELTGLPVVLRRLKGSEDDKSQNLSKQAVEARHQTLREARVLKSLRHRHIPRYFGLLEEDGGTYLVLEDMPGRTMAELIDANEPLSWALIRRYLSQFLSLLDYLHNQRLPIVHRDLKPSSVLVTPMQVLKIGEFGLARMQSDQVSDFETAFRSKGDPHYACPEQLMGESSKPCHDFYSVGALLYALASGKEPPEALGRLNAGSGISPLRQLREDCPKDLDESILALLSTDPEKRPKTANQVRAMLTDSPKDVVLPQFLQEEQASAIDDPGELETERLDSAPETNKLPEVPEPTRKSSMWQVLFGRSDSKKAADQPESEQAPEQPASSEFPFVDLTNLSLDRKIGRTLSEALCRTIQGVCIGKLSDYKITVACRDPSDVHIYDSIAMAASPDYKVTLVRADAKMVENALDYIFRSQHLAADTSWEVFLEQKSLDSERLTMISASAPVNFDDEALEGPIVQAVDQLIKEAISAGTSDIHLEPYEDGLDVRYRIDGVLRKVNRISAKDMSAVVKRLKVMGNMDIAQQRQTQGGRISLRLGEKEYDLRVSVIPVPAGESVVMRVLKKGAFTLTLGDLGFSERDAKKFRSLLSQPYGMLLVCGPTGSGKSTTLYASLKELARPDRKLLTVEDPIEYQMPGIMQVQVNRSPKEEEKKLTFSRALREFLRQDPDVILVGEIRDTETAEIGVQAALTGHLLLSTIHTNDAIGIISRLRDMDCEPFLISSVLLGGLAQRLARKLCPNCREEVEIPEQYLQLFKDHGLDSPKAYDSMGCRECNQTGTKGRVGLYELLEITPEIRQHITQSDSEEKMRATASKQGYRPLLADGLDKVNNGLISLTEVLRVCRSVGQSMAAE